MREFRSQARAVLFALFLIAGGLGAAAAATASPVTVHALLWRDSPTGPIGRVTAQAVDRFNRMNAGLITVVPQWVSPSDSTATLRRLTSSRGAPDVFMTDYAGLASLERSGRVFSLSPALAADPFWQGRFPSGALRPLSFRGQTLAVPSAIRVGVLYFNTKMFSTLGLTPPHTYDDLTVDIRGLTQVGVVPVAFADGSGIEGAHLAEQIALRENAQGPFEAALAGTGSWTDPTILMSAQALDQLVALQAFPAGFAKMTDAQAIEQFESGRAGMLYSSDPRLLTALDSVTSAVRDSVDATPFPSFQSVSGADPNAWVGEPELNLAISSSSTVKPAALSFVAFFSSPAIQTAIAQEGFLPVTTAVLGLHESVPLMGRVRAFTRDMTTLALPSNDVLKPSAEKAYQSSIGSILAGNDPQIALAELNREERTAASQ